MKELQNTEETNRLDEAREQGVPWKKWGPCLSERQWGTVREDYGEGSDAWNYFTRDHARYQGNEEGNNEALAKIAADL